MLLTPRYSARSKKRVSIYTADDVTIPMQGIVEVTDKDSGIVYRLRSAPCGLECHCDAVIVGTRYR